MIAKGLARKFDLFRVFTEMERDGGAGASRRNYKKPIGGPICEEFY